MKTLTEFGPDPFADTLPDTAELRPTIDLPELDEPATLEPFAEVQPEPELSIELPALEEPLAEPFPAIAEPELVAVPVEPEPALIEEPDPVVVAAEPAVNSAFAANPDVTIRKVAPAEAMIGDPLIYSIEISNNGERSITSRRSHLLSSCTEWSPRGQPRSGRLRIDSFRISVCVLMRKERERIIYVSISNARKIQNTCLIPHVDFHLPVPDFL